jgi:glycine/D-amino acid oxidase-like deaminating enzyme
MSTTYTAVVIGGGYYGCYLAVHLAKSGERVLLLEASEELFTRASYNNQARIHNGYHYPRDRMTALRSHQNFDRFIADHEGAVVNRCESYYAIARELSKVSARTFATMFERIGAPLSLAPHRIRKLFDACMVEEVFSVREYVFDGTALRNLMRNRLEQSRVEVHLSEPVCRILPLPDGLLEVQSTQRVCRTTDVYNCTYSQTNALLRASGVPEIPLKHELAEVALIRPPAALFGVGITVMCGPFFSSLPFPARKLHSLTHVSYTPQFSWVEGMGEIESRERAEALLRSPRTSGAPRMLAHAARFIPAFAEGRHVDSLWEVKTVLPRNERDDGRPILFQRDCGLRGLHCVLGAKFDNIYDLLDEVDKLDVARKGEPLTV